MMKKGTPNHRSVICLSCGSQKDEKHKEPVGEVWDLYSEGTECQAGQADCWAIPRNKNIKPFRCPLDLQASPSLEIHNLHWKLQVPE